LEESSLLCFALPRTNADVILLAGDIWCRQAGVDWAADIQAKSHEDHQRSAG